MEARAAVGDEDFEWAKLARFKRVVDHSLDVIREALKIGRLGVSFSGGKDSTCTLALVREVDPSAPAAFFDSGCELDSTLALVREVGAQTIHPRLTMLELARYSGWWGYANPVDRGCPFDAKCILIQEPSETFVVKHRLRVLAIGMRAEESGSRAVHLKTRGELYEGADRTWYSNPVARWDLRDVWAFIASRGLAYNAAYDRMTAAGVPRESQRVAGALGERGSGWGRHAILRAAHPEVWARLVMEFPGLSVSS